MKKLFIISFITLGITSIISQVVIIRELMISFYGNELFIGLALAGWLGFVAVGAFLGSKIKSISLYLWAIFFTPIFLIGEILAIRLVRSIITTTGQAPDLLYSLLYTLMVIAPLCLVLGIQFSSGNRFWLKFNQFLISRLVNRAYLFENLGFIIGGLLFSFLLIKVDEISTVWIITLINFFILSFLFCLLKIKLKKLLINGLVLLVLLLGLFSSEINTITSSWRFPKQELKVSQNSLYGNIAVTKTGFQYNYYENGLTLGNSNENLADEVLVHFPLLYSENPQNVLLIGGGLQDAIPEILKHPIKELYYLELDPDLLILTADYLSLQTKSALADNKLVIINQDALHFLKNTDQKFDVIITNLGNPSTILLNRYYTDEFFDGVKKHLEADGVFATLLSSSPNYLNKENLQLTNSVYQTLKENFEKVIILPEESIYYLASNNKLDYQPQLLIDRFLNRNLKNKLVIPAYLTYRLTNDRIATTLENFEKTATKINKNFTPNTYLYQNLFWASHFHPKLSNSFLKLTNFKIYYWFILLLIILITIFLLLRKKKLGLLPFTATIPDFTLFTLEIVLILLFQTFYGFVYSQIALIITLLFTGMTIGNALGIKLIKKLTISYKHLRYLYSLIALYCLSLPLIFNLLNNVSQTIGIYLVFPLIILTIGILNGLEFPLTNHLYLEKQTKKISAIYSADQLGSAFGALLASLILLPIIGVINTLIFLVILNLFVVILLIKRQKS